MTTILYLQGKKGRMGHAIVSLMENDLTFTLSENLPSCDVAIDFSAPVAILPFLSSCVKEKKPLVIGTTGYGEMERKMIQEASQHIPLFVASNFSVGMTLFREIVQELAKKVSPDTSIEIVEAHHRCKKDCPSGSATSLAEATGRSSLPIHSIRAGDIIGDHTVIFGLEGERIELKHQAHSRNAFARGALRAALFLKSQKAGFYTMQDLLYARN